MFDTPQRYNARFYKHHALGSDAPDTSNNWAENVLKPFQRKGFASGYEWMNTCRYLLPIRTK